MISQSVKAPSNDIAAYFELRNGECRRTVEAARRLTSPANTRTHTHRAF